MLRQASSRNQRSKGFRVKHALQIFLLVAVCVWLLYQLKHSHDKKIAYGERNSRILDKVVEGEPEFLKFGRKDLPHIEEKGSINEIHNKEEDSEEAQEEEENQEVKQEETEEEEGGGAGDDEIDEQDQGNADEEDERGDELAEELDRVDQVDELDLFDNLDHEGVSQEAREENYKRDDASSAVVHDTHATESETGNGDLRSSNDEQIENMEEKDVEAENGANKTAEDSNVDNDVTAGAIKEDVEAENMANKTAEDSKVDNDSDVGAINGSAGNVSDISVGENVTMADGISTNSTAAENRELEAKSSKVTDGSLSNPTAIENNNQGELQTNSMTAAESSDQLELPSNSTASLLSDQTGIQNNSTGDNLVTDVMTPHNDTISLDTVQGGKATNDSATPNKDEPNSENVVESTGKTNSTMGLELEEQSTTSSATNDSEDAARRESDDSITARPELEEQSTTSSVTDDNGDSAHRESDDASHGMVTEEEKDVRTDLSTLPDIQNEVAKNVDDDAIE